MTDPIVQHTSGLLALATAKHRAAIAAVKRRPIDLTEVRAAEQDLADCELLLLDCIDLTGDPTLETAVDELRHQRQLLAQGIARLEVETVPAPSLWATPWPWLSLTAMSVVVAIALA